VSVVSFDTVDIVTGILNFMARNDSDINKNKGKGNMILVEVAYATPEKQLIIPLKVDVGCTALEAAKLSAVNEKFPEIDLPNAKMGIFGKLLAKPEELELQENDRVEIYRPLIADPKEVRKKRAEKAKAEKQRLLEKKAGE